ncbi:MAG: acetyl-CoA carboxylase biotin carboxyl carrier protein subunit [Chlorobiaceae bacterium]|nr:acetyl-CoA carboxylase biotin carboxyl carrier protein subunit [Chlorobiaceae bacterium]MBA4310309.1 acetyl-CoA carboxylase biotin carboxyl carrier protein subunit [Chlorobiaceae bacterium]
MNKNELKSFIIDETKYQTFLTKKFIQRKKYQPHDPKKITAFIPGLICKIVVKDGQKIKEGESLLILEAMKMKNNLKSPKDGIIKKIHVNEGEKVMKDQLLLEFE